ncbi:LutC/YkgG family protein [Aquibium oceanicum]|uniref:Lactate utilization protein n=1 Tax=Aquibium oceanicum TaxID=1670800 RepID=A0A1L3SV28_9HYPH|nr:lactate utilization protein [Aquibium oceanicum]APH73269.1 lactate utilization protein [Aquibium oceanicum]
MSPRDAIMTKIRGALAGGGSDEARRSAVETRLSRPPKGIIPARGQLDDEARVELFCEMARKVTASVVRVRSHDRVPKAVGEYLRAKNLPSSIRLGDDRRLKSMPWDKHRSIEVKRGPSDGFDETGVSHAFAGVAETGTVAMTSGKENPTTINFLPEHHIVVVDAKDIAGDLESVMARVRRKFGKGEMPRTLNLITGPSRSGDIEQKIILGAHGPRAVHLIVVG